MIRDAIGLMALIILCGWPLLLQPEDIRWHKPPSLLVWHIR